MPFAPDTHEFLPIKPAKEWRTLGRGPHVSVMGIALDSKGFFPVIHRGPGVRSVKNCWSFPSGLHENGYTIDEQMAIELEEELGLKAVVDAEGLFWQYLGMYENIVVGNGKDEDDWHWVIHVGILLIQKDSHAFTNKEPHKCDDVRVVNYQDWDPTKFEPWSPGLKDFVYDHGLNIFNAAEFLLHG